MGGGYPQQRSLAVSERFQDELAFHTFMFGHTAQNGVQSSDAKISVSRNSETLVRGFFGLQHDVAAFLMDDAIAPITAKSLDQVVPAQVAWDLHEMATTSSRTKWRRIADGGCESSK